MHRRATNLLHLAIVCFKCARVATFCHMFPLQLTMGNRGTSVTTPFVMNPSASRQGKLSRGEIPRAEKSNGLRVHRRSSLLPDEKSAPSRKVQGPPCARGKFTPLSDEKPAQAEPPSFRILAANNKQKNNVRYINTYHTKT